MMELATSTDMRNGWEVQLFTREAIDCYWKNVQGMLEAVPHTWREWTIDALYERAMNGSLQVWGIGPKDSIRMIAFTQVAAFPATRVLEVTWMAGEGGLDYCLEVLDATITEYARVQQCDRIDIFGRVGWEKFAKPRGFKRVAVVLSRPVSKERIQ